MAKVMLIVVAFNWELFVWERVVSHEDCDYSGGDGGCLLVNIFSS